MNKRLFLEELDRKLRKLDKEERVEAILFYSELFDEMGLADEDQVPKKYDVNKISRDLILAMKIDHWEDEDPSMSKIFKSIPIIALAILSLPTLFVGFIVFLTLVFTALILIIGTYLAVFLLVIGTIKSFLLRGVKFESAILLLGVLLLVLSVTMIVVEILNLIGATIIRKIKSKHLDLERGR